MQKILIALAAFLFTIGAASAQTAAERPSFKQGDRWKTAVLDGVSKLPLGWQEEVVSGVGADMFLAAVKTNEGPQPPNRYDLDGNKLTDVKGKIERETKLSFPLEVNKSWNAKWDWINARGREGGMEIAYKVRKTEQVTVPAGTFDTVVIDGSGKWHNKTTSASGTLVEVIWYAPEAKRIVRRTWVTRYADGREDQNLLLEATEIAVSK